MRFDPEGNVSTAAPGAQQQQQQQHMNPYENGHAAAAAPGAYGQQGYGNHVSSGPYGAPTGGVMISGQMRPGLRPCEISGFSSNAARAQTL
jgi:hypothetical protein